MWLALFKKIILYSSFFDFVRTFETFVIGVGGASGSASIATALTDGDAPGCTTDWISIPCASDRMNSAYLSTSTTANLTGCVNKLCGVYFNALGSSASTHAPVYSPYK